MSEPVTTPPDYTPPGHVWLPTARLLATAAWFPEELKACDPGDQSPPLQSSGDPLADVIASGLYREGEPSWQERTWLQRAEPYLLQATTRLRDTLFQGRLAAVYFASDSGNSVEVNQGFWATARANGVIECGQFESWGAPSAGGRHRIEYLFVVESALTALLALSQGGGPARHSNSEAGSGLSKSGPKPRVQNVVKDQMRAFISREGMPALQALTEEAMKELFQASRDTCRKARAALSTETPTE